MTELVSNLLCNDFGAPYDLGSVLLTSGPCRIKPASGEICQCSCNQLHPSGIGTNPKLHCKHVFTDSTFKLEFHKVVWNHHLLSHALVLHTGQSLFLLLLGLSACHVSELQ